MDLPNLSSPKTPKTPKSQQSNEEMKIISQSQICAIELNSVYNCNGEFIRFLTMGNDSYYVFKSENSEYFFISSKVGINKYIGKVINITFVIDSSVEYKLPNEIIQFISDTDILTTPKRLYTLCIGKINESDPISVVNQPKAKPLVIELQSIQSINNSRVFHNIYVAYKLPG